MLSQHATGKFQGEADLGVGDLENDLELALTLGLVE